MFSWQASWFDHKCVNDLLIETIKQYQANRFLEPTGYVDTITYKTIYNEYNQSNIKLLKKDLTATSYLSLNKKSVNYYFSRFFTFVDNDSLLLNENQFYFNSEKHNRDLNNIIIKPDYCLTYDIAKLIDQQSETSNHFYIDFDGKIYQHTDIQNFVYTNSAKNLNDKSIHIEINNPVYPIYKNKFNLNRDLKNSEYLDYLPEQKKSLEFLLNCLNKNLSIANINYQKVGVS